MECDAFQSELPDHMKMLTLDVCVPEIIEYSDPDETIEWEWIEENATYKHKKNGECGVWEFILNLSIERKDIPTSLQRIYEVAVKSEAHYILFHQGT